MINIQKRIENAENGDVFEMLYLGDYYRKIKEYNKMLRYYLFAIEVDNSLYAKVKLGKYFEFIKCDYDAALNFYKKIDSDNHHVKRIDEKCINLVEFGTKNKIFLNKNCNLCSEQCVDIYKLNTCCKQKICIKCVCGIINKNYDFICPFCRNIAIITNDKKFELLDTDSDISDASYEDRHFISGIYYEDEF
jgi:hypothetical protein